MTNLLTGDTVLIGAFPEGEYWSSQAKYTGKKATVLGVQQRRVAQSYLVTLLCDGAELKIGANFLTKAEK